LSKLKGHRLEQLQQLKVDGAVSRDTAIAVSFCTHFLYRPATLSRMIHEGLVDNAYLPFKGDSRRRCSHYWLTAKGAEAARV
jgi:hypothetical protein